MILRISLFLSLLTVLPCAGLRAAPGGAIVHDEPIQVLDPIVITASRVISSPLEMSFDARGIVQPMPAQDGADLLKALPGFSVGRKGGTAGEVMLRGQAGSRIDLLQDGQTVLGGCPHRMDPPTAYIFPASFERITVLKGPQTVLYGPGNSAGVVLFESVPPYFATAGARMEGAVMFGSFGRNDQYARVEAGTPQFYTRAGFNRTESDDYEDGNGDTVHSQYYRRALNAAAGWTPDAHTLLEVSGTISEGEAAYAHSRRDATALDRQGAAIRFEKGEVTDLIGKIEVQFAYNYVDHVMDDFSLRTPGMMPMGESELDHCLYTGRAALQLLPMESLQLDIGADFQSGRHRSHNTGTWVADAQIARAGTFAEATLELSDADRLVAGLRADRWRAQDERAMVPMGMMGPMMPNPTAGAEREETLAAGFARYERDLHSSATAYAGIGYTERAPDYWELFSYESASTLSAFNTGTEKTTQLDVGVNYSQDGFDASIAAFWNQVDDFILVETQYMKGARGATIVRGVDTSSWGGEAAVGYRWATHWTVDASVAYVRGTNRTGDVPLAQQPPLEGRLGLAYSTQSWTAGAQVRMAAEQDRVAAKTGTVAGWDVGPTAGFTVVSLNAAWRINEHATLSMGVDNLFDRLYAEHVSRAAAAINGYPALLRVNEPGRVMWARLRFSF